MHLHQILTSLLVAHPIPPDVKTAVLEFHRIACIYLRHKAFVGTLRAGLIGLTLEDIAMDCIAPLFERDQFGRFKHLHTYFERLSWHSLSPEELLSAARRLVFSSVNQGLSKIWGQLDPSLAKLLRNLKAAIQASSKVQLLDRSGLCYVTLRGRHVDGDLREEMSLEYLEGMMSAHLHKGLSMKSVVGAVEEVLSDQLLYRREVPLMTLALAVRETSARASILIEEVVESDELSREEISDIIRACVTRVNERMESSYVENGKTDQILYDAYFNAVETLLLARYADQDGAGMSLFKCLADVRTNLSLVEYRRTHRAQLEYLFKLSEREFLASARKAL